MEGTDQYRIVILDTDSGRRDYLRSMISESGWVPFTFEKETICLDNLAALAPDLIVFGPIFPHRGFRFINTLRMRNGDTPLILISGDRDLEDFVKDHGHGGVLLIDPAFDPRELKKLVKGALQDKASSGTRGAHPLIVGTSSAIVQVRKLILGLGCSDEPVLVLGESGTGKDLVARVIYSRSQRSGSPFIKVDTDRLSKQIRETGAEKSDWLLSSDVFQKPKSLLNAANTGTIFLDEIGALPAALQSELLRVLEDRNDPGPDLDVRIIASNCRLLGPLVDDGLFRKDLYYRLSGFTIEIPPLRRRVEDIPLLTDYFADKFSMQLGRSHFEISGKTKELFCKYLWPGNVRELENLVRYIVFTGNEKGVVDRLLREEKNPYCAEQSVAAVNGLSDIRTYLQELQDLSLKTVCRMFIDRAEKQILQSALETNAWNRKKTASMLGISYRCLLSKMKEYNLVPSDE